MGDIKDFSFHYNHDCSKVIASLKFDEVGKILKLYPYEWIAREIEADSLLPHDLKEIDSIEPAWKLVLGNKAILPLLWEMYPDHPNLLPAYFIDPHE
jgi:glutathionylspermidine synthase